MPEHSGLLADSRIEPVRTDSIEPQQRPAQQKHHLQGSQSSMGDPAGQEDELAASLQQARRDGQAPKMIAKLFDELMSAIS